MTESVTIGIVGLGPWGLCVLERLIDAARKAPERELDVHVVEPRRPGGGIFSDDQPDYFVLNTPCGQHCLHPSLDDADEGSNKKSFYDWVREQGYVWQGRECRLIGPGGTGGGGVRQIAPGDFLPRRLMGEYLEWFYESLCRGAPPNVTVTHHRRVAEDVVSDGLGSETIYLRGGQRLRVDHVVLTTGHGGDLGGAESTGGATLSAYPVEAYLGSAGPGQTVAVEGMGLVAFDVLAALTTGLGGRFSDAGAGRLLYHPSGREPQIYMFSRSGYPYCAKSPGAGDPMGEYQPVICTSEAVARLQGGQHGGGRRQLDARAELLPLVFAEMELRYYTCAAFARGGRLAAEQVRTRLVDAWRQGSFSEQAEQLVGLYGRFSAPEHFFAGVGRHYADSAGYQSQVYKTVADDVDEALVPSGGSPVKMALETLRALRDTLRQAVEWKGLTLASHLDFTTNLQGRFARLVAGPPAFRCQELLALMDAGIVRMPFGPAPAVEVRADGRALVRSRHLEEPFEMVVDRLVRAHLDLPSVDNATVPLVAKLALRGRVRPLMFGSTPVGSIDLTEDFHPVGKDGRVQERLWVFGVLTEGARYFTLYIPSPKSRVRAFVDAELFARSVLLGQCARGGANGRPPLAARRRVWAKSAGGEVQAGHSSRALRVALVNNMPDAAFAETEYAFSALLGGSPLAEGGQIELGLFTLPGVQRGPEVGGRVAEAYLPMEKLQSWEPDALVVTGAEPKAAELSEEPYWPALESLLVWAKSSVPAMLVSCLSAHGALWAYDCLSRRLMLEKLSGVYQQQIVGAHPLMSGVGPIALPHSRFNEIPEAALEEAGYSVLARSDASGWTVAVGQRGCCHVLLLQGHPEYTPLTLLREYRRDVRRYLSGTQGYYPKVPAGYLDAEGVAALEEFAEQALQEGSPELMGQFPYQFVSEHVVADWSAQAATFMRNWVLYACQLSGKAGSPAGGQPGRGQLGETLAVK
jgi:homoserine O-succinyltransferase